MLVAFRGNSLTLSTSFVGTSNLNMGLQLHLLRLTARPFQLLGNSSHIELDPI